jgi:Uma2 family endonuclease
MSGTLIPPEFELFPNRIRWTVDDCTRLVESGCLRGRYELIDGEIILKTGQGPTHSFILQMIAEWLVNCFGLHRVRTQLPITIPREEGANTQPEPDLVVTTQPRAAYTLRHPRHEMSYVRAYRTIEPVVHFSPSVPTISDVQWTLKTKFLHGEL